MSGAFWLTWQSDFLERRHTIYSPRDITRFRTKGKLKPGEGTKGFSDIQVRSYEADQSHAPLQVINSIQTGPYKNIYNPENFFIGHQGIGAGNNWGAGYATGEVVQEEVFDMIDREADGSDSLEASSAPFSDQPCRHPQG